MFPPEPSAGVSREPQIPLAQLSRHMQRSFVASKINGNDLRRARSGVKPGSGHGFAKRRRDSPKMGALGVRRDRKIERRSNLSRQDTEASPC